MSRDTRRGLLANAWAQMFLVVLICVLANTWSSHRFFRIDLTSDGIHSLDLATRSLAHRLEKPLTVKVYFTEDLKAPYHNHRQVVIDMLEELSAYSRGMMEIQVVDPTGDEVLQSEARRFGILPMDQSYTSASLKEMRKVYMGVALVSGSAQEVLPAIRQTTTLEYDLARALKRIVSKDARKRVGFTQGHGEIDLSKGSSYQARIREGVSENVDLVAVPIGGAEGVPEDIDALLVLGPTQQLDPRSLYHLDQFLMRGGAVAFFVTNIRGDIRKGRAYGVNHGLDTLLTHYGVTVNKDVVLDRKKNSVMHFPVRQGRYMLKMPINYALMPRVTNLAHDSPIVGPLKGLVFPFASTLSLTDPMPEEVEATVLATASGTAKRVTRLPSINPRGLTKPLPGEESGTWPMMVAMRGTWSSFFAGRDIPPPSRPTGTWVQDDPRSKLVESAEARMVVLGSLDFVGNNVGFMLNLVDWLVQDESLIRIRSKNLSAAPLTPPEEQAAHLIRALNLGGGAVLLWLFGLMRRGFRGRGKKRTWTRALGKKRTVDALLDSADRLRENSPLAGPPAVRSSEKATEQDGDLLGPEEPSVMSRASAAVASDRAPRAGPTGAENRAPSKGGATRQSAVARYRRHVSQSPPVGRQAPVSEGVADPPDPWSEDPPDPPDPWLEDSADAQADPPTEPAPAPSQPPHERKIWSLADEVSEAAPDDSIDEKEQEASRRRAARARRAMARLKAVEERQARVNASVVVDDEPDPQAPAAAVPPPPEVPGPPKQDEQGKTKGKASHVSVLQRMAAKKAEAKKAAQEKKAAGKREARESSPEKGHES